MKLWKYISIILLFISCSKQEKGIELPTSDFNNFTISENSSDYFIYVNQLSNEKYEIIDNDTLFSILDSTLHEKIYEFNNYRRNHEYPKIVLNLDKKTPYLDFKNLTKEFRKVFNQSFVINLKGEDDLRLQFPPYIQNESEYIMPELKGKGAPDYKYLFEEYSIENKYLNLAVSATSDLKITDSKSELITDLKEYWLKNKKLIIFYEFEQKCDLQNYVDMFSYVNKIKTEIWKLEKVSEELTDEKIRGKYSIILEEKTHYNNVYN